MNNRYDVLESLRNAQISHKRWVDYGIDLYEGKNMESVQAPMHFTECVFGKWFYTERDNIKNVPGFKDIEEKHEVFNDLYKTLYNNAFVAHAQSSGMFSKKSKEQKLKKEFLLKNLNDLKEQSKQLVKLLVQVEKLVELMSDRLFIRNKNSTASV